ncbi:MAG: cadmium-translocating P-type ATPase [Gammaproteobacteria bacterium]|nr:cadmium-translocating P-type ATPase [Gammaproteobacteria bacterium]
MTDCFHCNQSVPESINEKLFWHNQEVEFCCLGCKSVAKTIIDNGLEDYYKFRTETSIKPEDLIPQELRDLELIDDEQIQRNFVHKEQHTKSAELGVEGITCAACSWIIETRLQKMQGLLSVQVNPITQRIKLKWDDSIVSLSHLLKALLSIGYKTYPFQQNQFESSIRKENRKYLMRLGVAGLGMMQVMMFALGIYLGDGDDLTLQQETFLHMVSGIVATPIVLFSAFPFYRNAWYGLKSKTLVMDVPVVIAISVAYISSVTATINGNGTVYFDSVSMFIFFLLVGRFLEHRVRVKSVESTQHQRQLLPLTVAIETDLEEQHIPLNQVTQDDIVIVGPGETIAVDGVIVQGTSDVNEALLTGESVPIKKQKGDQVLAGSVNQSQVLKVKAIVVGASTYISALQRMTEEASHSRPNITKITDKVAHWFVLSILLIVTLVYWIWLSVDPDKAFWIALSVLVVSCPCALSLATPTALTTASQRLSKFGFLILKHHTLETLTKINHVCFDKTGTLTEGRLSLTKVTLLSDEFSEKDVINIAASLEQKQSHPIAKALLQTKFAQQAITDVKLLSGKGLTARYLNQTVRLGSLDFCQEESQSTEHFIDPNNIEIFLNINHRLVAKLTFSDSIKSSSESLIKRLKQRGITTTILSGDHPVRVEQLAKQLGIEHFEGRLSPEQKADYVAELQANNQTVLMLGDGINDALVLALANIGIAVDSATDITRLSADAVLTAKNIKLIDTAIELATKTNTIIKQNLTWALSYNVFAIPFAAMGWVPPWLAAVGMTSSSIIVLLNALRLNR